MIESGLVQEMLVVQPDQTELHLSLAFMGHDGLGELLIGEDDYSRADRDASNRSREGRMLLVGIDGNSSQPFRQERLAIKQGEDVYPLRGSVLFTQVVLTSARSKIEPVSLVPSC